MHVAESDAEFDMYLHRRGPMFDWLRKQRDMSDCGLGTPVAQVARCGLLGANFLAVHANYLEAHDVAALARAGASVAHCPRSHAYFGHRPFPYPQLAAAGVNVCLGTDSLASVKTTGRAKAELNMFAEMRAFALSQPDVAPAEVLRMATQAGARAPGLSGAGWRSFPPRSGRFDRAPFRRQNGGRARRRRASHRRAFRRDD